MRLEIERKFLVASDEWRAAVTRSRHLRDGLIGPHDASKVRVRREDDRAWLTVKGPRAGLGRLEFEYEIPLDHADEMLRNVCDGMQIEKTRHEVPHGDLIWEIDVYGGLLAGVVLAEVELESEDQPLLPPDWIGAEVTGDPRFKKEAMLRLARQAGRPLTVAAILGGDPWRRSGVTGLPL